MFGEPRAERFLRKTHTEVGLMTKEEEEDALELLEYDDFDYSYLGSPNDWDYLGKDLDNHQEEFAYELSPGRDVFWDDFSDD